MPKKKLSDLVEIFANVDDVPDKIIYEYDNVERGDAETDLCYGTTIIYPGAVNGEYHMTRGHVHVNDTPEVYRCISGNGYVLVSKDGEERLYKFSAGESIYVEPGYAHRVINSGNSNLIFFCVYPGNAGHDYNVIFTTRLFSN